MMTLSLPLNAISGKVVRVWQGRLLKMEDDPDCQKDHQDPEQQAQDAQRHLASQGAPSPKPGGSPFHGGHAGSTCEIICTWDCKFGREHPLAAREARQGLSQG